MQPDDPFVATLHEWVEVFMRRSMRQFIRYTHDCGLSMSQVGALFHVRREGGSGVTDLGNHLGVTSAAASQILERLVQQGLILRTEDPLDRRQKQLLLTEKGARILQESIHARQGWVDELSNTLSSSEKELVIEALNILISKMKRLNTYTVTKC
jgi:DNA-binding MarR family transcriptional regulator